MKKVIYIRIIWQISVLVIVCCCSKQDTSYINPLVTTKIREHIVEMNLTDKKKLVICSTTMPVINTDSISISLQVIGNKQVFEEILHRFDIMHTFEIGDSIIVATLERKNPLILNKENKIKSELVKSYIDNNNYTNDGVSHYMPIILRFVGNKYIGDDYLPPENNPLERLRVSKNNKFY